jgi:hypothetical protein
VAVRPYGIFNVTASFSTMSDLCETHDPAASLKAASGERISTLTRIFVNTPRDRRDGAGRQAPQ